MRVSFISEEEQGDRRLKRVSSRSLTSLACHRSCMTARIEWRFYLMVSNFGHCLNDLLYRWQIGALPIDVVGVVSNHLTYQKVVMNHDIPFHYIKVMKENKQQAEADLMQIIEDTGAEVIVLARYMQILSDALCHKMSGRIINIHHSFLPSFRGANPYKQAFERGVKLIGANRALRYRRP
ncbi:formyltransferase family protein [Mesorhizobium sp.]|nr:formyltransferase family protein [Mesorhizobium sp.]